MFYAAAKAGQLIHYMLPNQMRQIIHVHCSIQSALRVAKLVEIGDLYVLCCTYSGQPVLYGVGVTSAHISGDLNPGLVGVYPQHLLYKLGA
jgi:hypothetical protein